MNKGIGMIVATASMAVLSIGMTAYARGEQTAVVDCKKGVILREAASEESKALMTIKNKEMVSVLKTYDNGWSLVDCGEDIGYIKSKRLVEVEQHEFALTTSEWLNIRISPNADAEIMAAVPAGSRLLVLEHAEDGWLKVYITDGLSGYVRGKFCELSTGYGKPTEITLELPEEGKESRTENTEVIQQEEPVQEKEAEAYKQPETEWQEPETQWQSQENQWQSQGNQWQESENQWQSQENEWQEPETEWTSAQQWDESNHQSDTMNYGTYTEEGVSQSYKEVSAGSSTDASKGQQIADFATQFVGNSYAYGGTSLTNGTDCSGFTQSIMSNFGIDINRVAADQATGGTSVSEENYLPGDLLYYSDGSGDVTHVAMYIGDGQIVHAMDEENGITVSNYDYMDPVGASRYWE